MRPLQQAAFCRSWEPSPPCRHRGDRRRPDRGPEKRCERNPATFIRSPPLRGRAPPADGHCKLKNGAVAVRLDKLNSPPWFLNKVEAASNRQHVIVDLGNRVDAAQPHGGEHFPWRRRPVRRPLSHRHRRGRSCRIWRRARARASRPGQGGTAPSSQSFDLGQAPVQSESNSARGWITASWVGCSPNDRAQSTGRKRHVSLCSTGSCSTRSSYSQPHPGRRVRAPWGWWRIPRRWRLPRRRRPSWRRSPRWSLCRSRRRGSRGLPRRVLSTSRIRCGGGGRRSGWCRGLRRLRLLQQLLRHVRQLYLRQSVSILTRAERMPTAVGPVLTAVAFS